MSMFCSPFLTPTRNLQTYLLISNVIDFEAARTGDLSAPEARAICLLALDTVEVVPLDLPENTLLVVVFVLVWPIWLGV